METDAAEGGVGHGAAAKGEVEVPELLAAKGQDFGRRVREGAAEGLPQDDVVSV